MKVLTAMVIVATVACGGSPTSPGGERERVTWTVNGESFTASSNGMGALRAGSALSLTAGDCGSGAVLSMLVRAANFTSGQTYQVGDGDGMVTANWTPDARTGAAAGEAWSAPGLSRVGNNVIVRPGSGLLTITSISADWVAGTFTFENLANPSNRDVGTKTVQGSFELSFRERTIC